MSSPQVRIDDLSADEQLDLIERLWDNLSRNPANVPLTGPQEAELDRRLDAMDKDLVRGRVRGIPWDEVVRQIRARR